MKVNNKKMGVVFVLVILEISSLFLMYKSNSNKEIKLDNVENKEVVNNNMLAIMIEQSNGTYSQYTTTNTWPSDTTYVLNTLKSGCVDNDGNKVKDGMTFDKTNRKIIVSTNKTSNCYAYFTRNALYKVQNNSQVWNSDLSNDGYRFFGVNPNNYVCFGSQSKSECVSNTDKYMYRIIGMFQEETTSGSYNIVNSSSDYHLKLIKKEALNTKYVWNEDYTSDVKWSQSDLYKGLNGSYFVNNMDYSYMKDNYWYSKISNWKWTSVTTTTSINYLSMTATNIYLDEMNRSTKVNTTSTYESPIAKIGLIYSNDYMLSLGSVAKNYLGNDNNLKTGWLHITNNDSTSPSNFEWTISRQGTNGAYYKAYWIGSNGSVYDFRVADPDESVRPAFYLNSDVVICGGTGTSTDPYILG